ncbi:MAG: hypothetical protein GYA21_20230 [Myxococcales bacterium]|nr:hypothetical protein [Myxococcales bacterium]
MNGRIVAFCGSACAIAAALGLGCSEGPRCLLHAVSQGDPNPVVPADGLPPEVALQPANNNLDVTVHQGRVFLAFRTSGSHFASATTELYVVSSEDATSWRFEGRFFRGTDLREPRLLSWGEKLFVYFAVLGSDPLAFEPQGMMVSEYLAPGRFSEPEWFYQSGFIPWRARVESGVPYLLSYVGGENIYEVNGKPIEVHWLKTSDGRTFEPVIPAQPVVLRGGGSETDFVFLDDGSLVAVSRDELGDELGWGTRICNAPRDDLGRWECVMDPKKYDSPLLFRQDGAVYLVGRRNLTESGNYDLFLRDLSPAEQTHRYEGDYSSRQKRCSLWRVNPHERRVEFVLDLPSRGDTCFPALRRLAPDTVEIYNYTSPLDGPDLSWFESQLRETVINRVTLTFECVFE